MYKRQGYYNIEDKCIVIKENMSEVQTAKTLIHEIAPVSYTHLDVYKRQVLY